MHPIAHNKGKEPIVPDDVNTPANDELSIRSSLSLSLSSTKNAQESTKAKSRKRPSPLVMPLVVLKHHLAFSDAISGASRRARREAGRRQNMPYQAPGNPLVLPSGTMPPMPPVHPTFGAAPTFYMPPAA